MTDLINITLGYKIYINVSKYFTLQIVSVINKIYESVKKL